MILLALLYQGYEVYSGKTKKGEIDFVAIRNGETKYIQVAISIENEETRRREIGAFDEVADHYPKYIITGDTVDYSENGVEWVNIIDFISGNI